MRLGHISTRLRRELWNTARRQLNELPRFDGLFIQNGAVFVEQVIGRYREMNEDEVSIRYRTVMSLFKTVILEHPYNRVLDLVEMMVQHPGLSRTSFGSETRVLFEMHGAAYRLSTSFPWQFIPRSTEAQGEAAARSTEALQKSGMDGASAHLQQAAGHLRHQRYAESITASVHAVESVARLLDPAASKNLGPALNSLERSGLLNHKALKSGILKLYGYASDEQGVRHALLDKKAADVGEDEALFMYGACACFAAYLADKHRKT